MKKNKLSGKLHKILSLIFIPLFLIFAISGIGLNHSDAIKSFSIPVKNLPDNYQFKNWNRGIIQSLAKDDKNGIYAGGKNGLGYFNKQNYQPITNPLADNAWQNFIYSLYFDSSTKQVFVGSRDGLFSYNTHLNKWHYFKSTQGLRIISLSYDSNTDNIIVVSNHQIFTISDLKKPSIKPIDISLAKTTQAVPLFRLIFALHSGEVWGGIGILLMDLVALGLIYFCFSGLYYWIFPKLIKQKLISRNKRIKGGRIFRWLSKHHNTWGLLMMPLLLISGITAMVMRPPGLILIASSNSPIATYPSHGNSKIPYKITKAAFIKDKLVLVTDDGVFTGNVIEGAQFNQITFPVPVHGMGTTIFQKYNNDRILVGSFSGLYSWQANTNQFNSVNLTSFNRGLMPMAVYQENNELIVFDYFQGKLFDEKSTFSKMPTNINQTAKMGLWNFFFELHNLRIFQQYIGNFYLLLLLLSALVFIIITFTGTIIYLRKRG